MNCTWVDCKNEGVHALKDRGGETWATLCDMHNNLFEDTIKLGNADPKTYAPRIVSNWIKAQGGSKKAAERMGF